MQKRENDLLENYGCAFKRVKDKKVSEILVSKEENIVYKFTIRDSIDYFIINIVRAFLTLIKHDCDTTYFQILKGLGYKTIDILETDEIKNRILDGTPTFLGRMGNTEAAIVNSYCKKRAKVTKRYKTCWIEWLYQTSGFFSDDYKEIDQAVDEFSELLISCYSECDYMPVSFPPFKYQLFSYGHFLRHVKMVDDRKKQYFEFGPYCDKPIRDTWIGALKGKKVLVANSFTDSIRLQYERKSEWAYSPECELPDFELITYKTYTTQVGERPEGFTNFFQVLRKMIDDIRKIDFDIALIGAGAYGFPLGCEIKKMGKIAIEPCGRLPAFFGVYGEFLLTSDLLYKKFINENWIRPIETPPQNYKQVENGCYW